MRNLIIRSLPAIHCTLYVELLSFAHACGEILKNIRTITSLSGANVWILLWDLQALKKKECRQRCQEHANILQKQIDLKEAAHRAISIYDLEVSL